MKPRIKRNNSLSSPGTGEDARRAGEGLGSRTGQHTRLRRAAIGVSIIVGFIAPLPALAQTHFDPTTGYRIEQYRAPVPQSVPGGTTITLETLQALVRDQQAVLLDVTPLEGPGADPATGVWHVPKPRANMAGSVWLPDVGRGTLTPALEAYFQSNLKALTGGNKARAVIVYCQADCWMSWNAVKRAAGYGYTALYWYPDGTDGMRDWDLPLVPASPVSVTR